MLKNFQKLIKNLTEFENYIENVINNEQKNDQEIGRMLNKCMG